MRARTKSIVTSCLFALALTAISTPRTASAGDLYTLFDGSCRATSGVLVHVNAKRVLLVDLSGHLASIAREQIHAVVLHNLLENPLAELTIDREFERRLRNIWIGDDNQASFTGWATAFFDDLLIFADLNGKTHVVDPADIAKMSPVAITQRRLAPTIYAAPALGFPPEIVPCAKTPPRTGALPPSRVIADRIKIGGHFSKLEEAYLALDGFEERTLVYARPFVFEDAARVGLFYHQDSPLPMPFYFRWASGRPYRFQSETVIGNTVHSWLPTTTPSLSFASDAKSHFFNATFVGNIVALPAGANAFLLDQLGDEPTTKLAVEVSHNYIMLIGADYWRLSASAGPSYLSTKLYLPGNHVARALPAESPSPTLRLRYLGSLFDLRAMYFRTRLSGELADILPEGFDNVEVSGDYALSADVIRLGVTVTVLDEIEIALDQLVTRGQYAEQDNADDPVELTYLYFDTNAQISSNFGRYVTVRGHARMLMRRHDVAQPSDLQNHSRTELRVGGALEFMF